MIFRTINAMGKVSVLHDNEPTRCIVGTIDVKEGGRFPIFAADYRQSANQENADKLLRFLIAQRWIVLRIFSDTYHVFVDEDMTIPAMLDGRLHVISWYLKYKPNEADRDAFFKALMEQGSWVLCVITQSKVLRSIIGPMCRIVTSSVVEATPENTEIFDHISI